MGKSIMLGNAIGRSNCLAVVAIGRNEGARLQMCLKSALASGLADLVVYVDSGSSDGSVAMAQNLGCIVVDLNMRIPFTAARARNEGLSRALELQPNLTLVQFIDGDCELFLGWMQVAMDFLTLNYAVAVVAGRLRERCPEASVYNQLCDIEWNTPIGEVKTCGGIAMFRVAALQEIKGFREDLVAGEEPELCVRLRAAKWRVWRLDQDMALHDAAILRFSQWWRRSKRAGHAFAEGAALHGAPPEQHWVKESRSAWLWGAILPIGIFTLSAALSVWMLLFIAVYPLQVLRIWFRARHTVPAPGWYAFFLVLGKVPEMLGQLKFELGRLGGKRSGLIEYK